MAAAAPHMSRIVMSSPGFGQGWWLLRLRSWGLYDAEAAGGLAASGRPQASGQSVTTG